MLSLSLLRSVSIFHKSYLAVQVRTHFYKRFEKNLPNPTIYEDTFLRCSMFSMQCMWMWWPKGLFGLELEKKEKKKKGKEKKGAGLTVKPGCNKADEWKSGIFHFLSPIWCLYFPSREQDPWTEDRTDTGTSYVSPGQARHWHETVYCSQWVQPPDPVELYPRGLQEPWEAMAQPLSARGRDVTVWTLNTPKMPCCEWEDLVLDRPGGKDAGQLPCSDPGQVV